MHSPASGGFRGFGGCGWAGLRFAIVVLAAAVAGLTTRPPAAQAQAAAVQSRVTWDIEIDKVLSSCPPGVDCRDETITTVTGGWSGSAERLFDGSYAGFQESPAEITIVEEGISRRPCPTFPDDNDFSLRVAVTETTRRLEARLPSDLPPFLDPVSVSPDRSTAVFRLAAAGEASIDSRFQVFETSCLTGLRSLTFQSGGSGSERTTLFQMPSDLVLEPTSGASRVAFEVDETRDDTRYRIRAEVPAVPEIATIEATQAIQTVPYPGGSQSTQKVPLIAGKPLLLRALVREAGASVGGLVTILWDGQPLDTTQPYVWSAGCTPYAQRAHYRRCRSADAVVVDPTPGPHALGVRVTDGAGRLIDEIPSLRELDIEPAARLGLWLVSVCPEADLADCRAPDPVTLLDRPAALPSGLSPVDYLTRMLPVSEIALFDSGMQINMIASRDDDPLYGNGDGDELDCYADDGTELLDIADPRFFMDPTVETFGNTYSLCRSFPACEIEAWKDNVLNLLECYASEGGVARLEEGLGFPLLPYGVVDEEPPRATPTEPARRGGGAASEYEAVSFFSVDADHVQESTETAAHEILHLLGQDHPGTNLDGLGVEDRCPGGGGPRDEGPSQPPLRYAYPPLVEPPHYTANVTGVDLQASGDLQVGILLGADPGVRSGYQRFGLDVGASRSRRADAPNHDVMAYCPPRTWITPDAYLGAHDALVTRQQEIDARRGRRVQQLVGVAAEDAPGTLRLSFGVSGIGPVQALPRPPTAVPYPAIADPDPDDTAQVQLLDAQGNVLASKTALVRTARRSEFRELEYDVARVELPALSGAATIRFSAGDEPGASGGVSVPVGSGPLLTWIFPEPGTTPPILAGKQVISWTTGAGDAPLLLQRTSDGATRTVSQALGPDRGAIEHRLEYSPDDGATWIAVADGIGGRRQLVDFDALPGSAGEGRLRLLGFSESGTGAIVSDPFSVPTASPQVRITEPASPRLTLAGWALRLAGTAFDAEEGRLVGPALVWGSDLDGPLGAGEQLEDVLLSEGLHRITLVATDASGAVGEAAVEIEVVAALAEPPDADGDGLPDDAEEILGTDRALADSDGDGLSDFDEVNRGFADLVYDPGSDTDPLNADSDGDTVPDGSDPAPLDPDDPIHVPEPGAPLQLAALGLALWSLRWIVRCSRSDRVGRAVGPVLAAIVVAAGRAGADEPAFPGFGPELSAGTFWVYGWDAELFTGTASGNTTERGGGTFRLTLGPPEPVRGLEAFPIAVTGNPTDADGDERWEVAPRWTHLAVDDNRLLASADGSPWEVLFDGDLGVWVGGGFFTAFPDDTLIVATAGSIDNAYLSQPAIETGRSLRQDQCETIGGEVFCGDESFSLQESEYHRAGVGVVGYRYVNNSSFSGGGVGTIFNDELNIGLIASSLRGDRFDAVLEVEPNNDPTLNANPLAPDSVVLGALNDEESFGGGVLVPNELEPNDDVDTPQPLAFPVAVTGTIGSDDPSQVIGIPPLDGIGGYNASFEDFFAITVPGEGCGSTIFSFGFSDDPPPAGGALDLYVFTYDGFGLFYEARNLVKTPSGVERRSSLFDPVGPGDYLIALDAIGVPVPSGYVVRLGCEGLPFPETLEPVDWYALTLSSTEDGELLLSGGPGLLLTDADGTAPIAFGERLGDIAALSLSGLPAGSYRVGVYRESSAPIDDEYVLARTLPEPAAGLGAGAMAAALALLGRRAASRAGNPGRPARRG